MKKIVVLIFIALLYSFNCNSYAGIKNGPISINSDKAIYLQNENKIKFLGNVYVEGKDFKLYCDNLELILNKGVSQKNRIKNDKSSIKEMIATGNVHIILQGKEAFCKKAQYNLLDQYIVLTGEVKLIQDKNKIMGDRLIIDLKNNKSEIFSNSTNRVKVIFSPKRNGETNSTN